MQWFSRHKPDRSDAARVDYILVSHNLADSVQKIEYLEEPSWRFQSDHAPISLSVKLDTGIKSAE